jgi:coniferyl-aldehyde dehydrogenase
MRAAAENLTPVTLELGGKSPAIVCPDYPIEKAANAIAFGKFVNAGQTCIAPDYVLVPAQSAQAFAQAVLKSALRGYPTIAANDDYSHIITPRHHARLTAAVEQARAAGATVLTHPDADSAGGKFPPTVVLNAPADSVLLTEEIFGPVLPVVGYTSLQQAIAFAGQRDRPLALYCFSDDRRAQAEVLNGVQSGGVTLNGTLMHIAQHDLPFGGVGPSGSGAYHGQDGFRRFSHARAVHALGFVNPFQWIGPPWGELARWAGRVLRR